MNIDGIEVSYVCSVYALFEYVIKHEYVLTDKWLILACAVTYVIIINVIDVCCVSLSAGLYKINVLGAAENCGM